MNHWRTRSIRILPSIWVLATLILWASYADKAIPDRLESEPPARKSLDRGLRLPAIFGDHMILQRDQAIPVWGTAAPGATVAVKLGEQAATANADGQGRWRVKLDPLSAGGPHALSIQAGETAITFTDVLVGEVWLCAGQSNMGFPVNRERDSEATLAASDRPNVRMFLVAETVAVEPRFDPDGRWEVCTSATLGRHSSIGYHLIRDIQEKFQGLPVGMIEASWSSRGAECFMAREWLEADPELEPTLAQTDRSIRNWRAAMARYEATPAAERTEETPRLPQSRPPFIYNAMIAPVIPYGMRGAVWYQGESNILRAEQYRHLLPALIRSWRKAWGQGDFPFLIVQLANYEPRPKTESPPFESEVAELREAQMSALALPRTAVVVSCDLGEGTDVHPLGRAGIDFRKMVAGRLGNAALSVAYGREGSDSAIPSYRAMSVEGDAIRIDFANPNGGLVARGSLEGFAVAGADRNFEPAEARLEGGSVIVRSSLVSCPVAVRYAWLANPKMSLYDRSGRPVAPFRTDDWPGLTAGRRTVEANDPAL